MLVLFQLTQVKLHLVFVDSFKLTQFQVDGHQTSQTAIVKKQVDVIVAVADGDSLCLAKKAKSLPSSMMKRCISAMMQVKILLGAWSAAKS